MNLKVLFARFHSRFWGENATNTSTGIVVCLLFLLTFYYYSHNRNSIVSTFHSENLRSRGGAVKADDRVRVKSQKWIVVTSIFHPTEQIKKLSQIPEWQLLVVADKKTPTNWSYPGVIVLDVSTQLSLNYAIVKLLPWNSYTRKVIGYLYAIQHGAKFIYDTDDDNSPNDPSTFEKGFAFEESTRGLVLTSENGKVPNPYIHFGQPSVWPRGYPLENIGKPYNNSYTACTMNTPPIQQGLVNGDPDIDAIFRLTRKKIYTPLNIQFDASAPPLILPKSVLAPFNSQNTIFHYKAFWAMLLPTTVTFRVTDIWRGYWAQPLLWTIGSQLGFYPPQTVQLRNAHYYLKDFAEEDKLYKEAGSLADLLAEWKCSGEHLFECMLELTTAMAESSFWVFNEVALVQAWISDLKLVGYSAPPLVSNVSFCLDDKPQSYAMFSPVQIDKAHGNCSEFRGPLRKFCKFPLSFLPENRSASQPILFESTLLVITFNSPHYENIWLLDLVYRHNFPNILYCGHLDNSIVLYDLLDNEFTEAKLTGFSFVRANMSDGNLAYACAQRALDMKYGPTIDGYLVLSDDVLLNFWNNAKFNKHEPWVFEMFPINIDLPPRFSNTWNAFWASHGYNTTKAALDRIYDLNQSNPILKKFREERETFGHNSSVAFQGLSDIFYFPASKQEVVYEIITIFIENGLFLEIAVPTLMSGLTSPENLVYLPGKYLLEAARRNPFRFYTNEVSFVHPVKFSGVITNSSLRSEFCTKYVQHILTFDK